MFTLTLLSPRKKKERGGGEKVASALIFADCLQVFAAVYMQVPLGLIRGNGIGLLTTSAHARLFPAQQPRRKRGERFTITRLTSPGLQTHSRCSGSAAPSKKVTSSFEIPLSKIVTVKWILIWIREDERRGRGDEQAGQLIVREGSVAPGLLSGWSFGFLLSVLVGFLCPSSSSHVAQPFLALLPPCPFDLF